MDQTLFDRDPFFGDFDDEPGISDEDCEGNQEEGDSE